jgi:hypothetical protein
MGHWDIRFSLDSFVSADPAPSCSKRVFPGKNCGKLTQIVSSRPPFSNMYRLLGHLYKTCSENEADSDLYELVHTRSRRVDWGKLPHKKTLCIKKKMHTASLSIICTIVRELVQVMGVGWLPQRHFRGVKGDGTRNTWQHCARGFGA